MTAPLRNARAAAVALAGVAVVAAGIFAPGSMVRLPDHWNPWSPLDPLAAPNLLTPWKVSLAEADGPACRSALARTALQWRLEPDRPPYDGCDWSDAVRVTGAPARLSVPAVLSCPAALALAMWERHSLQPAAEAAFGSTVTHIEHFGSFTCRDIGSRTGDDPRNVRGQRSEHARANALDIAGFVLADGRSVPVQVNRAHDDVQGRFLRSAHAGACRYFNVVLGPDYDAAHRDHFHLDVGRGRACR